MNGLVISFSVAFIKTIDHSDDSTIVVNQTSQWKESELPSRRSCLDTHWTEEKYTMCGDVLQHPNRFKQRYCKLWELRDHFRCQCDFFSVLAIPTFIDVNTKQCKKGSAASITVHWLPGLD